MSISAETGVAAMMDSDRKSDIFPVPPTFTSKIEERDYLKFRLAQAFRIFGEYSSFILVF